MENPNLSPESVAVLDSLITKHNLVVYREIILNSAMEFAVLEITEPEEYKTSGNSRYGGLPDLPAELEWPRNSEGQYLVFLMQVNLADIPPLQGSQLSQSGWLYCFLESDEGNVVDGNFTPEISVRLLFYSGAVSSLSLADAPPEEEYVEASEYYVEGINPHSLTTRRAIDLLSYGSSLYESLESSDPSFNSDAFFSLCEEAIGESRNRRSGGLLGFPTELSGNPSEDAFLIRSGQGKHVYDWGWREPNSDMISAGAAEWRLLWRIESNLIVSTCFGDAGFIEILIKNDDLAAGNFDNTYSHLFSS